MKAPVIFDGRNLYNPTSWPIWGSTTFTSARRWISKVSGTGLRPVIERGSRRLAAACRAVLEPPWRAGTAPPMQLEREVHPKPCLPTTGDSLNIHGRPAPPGPGRLLHPAGPGGRGLHAGRVSLGPGGAHLPGGPGGGGGGGAGDPHPGGRRQRGQQPGGPGGPGGGPGPGGR